MKQKIVIKMQLHGGKCRSKAMQIASVADGVTSVAIEGEDKDPVVVIGDGVDSASLANSLRKKVGYADIISVEEVKAKVEEDKKDPPPIQYSQTSCYQYPQFYACELVYDPNPTVCSIM